MGIAIRTAGLSRQYGPVRALAGLDGAGARHLVCREPSLDELFPARHGELNLRTFAPGKAAAGRPG